MGHPSYIAVIGPGNCSPSEYEEAQHVGRLIAMHGATLVCGGLTGVMEAAARGAKEAGGHTIGILPGHVRSAANPFIDHAITTGLGQARNLIVVSSSDAVIAVGRGYGTLSEIGLAAKIGRPVIILHGWRLQSDTRTEAREGIDSAILRYASSAQQAVALAYTLPVHLQPPGQPRET
ncbi:MAG: TIGR00725 family protein [Thermoleophilia bacterium]|jgi:uncharacterized protein (TIGR00725 family)